jgi:hypothetical protein
MPVTYILDGSCFMLYSGHLIISLRDYLIHRFTLSARSTGVYLCGLKWDHASCIQGFFYLICVLIWGFSITPSIS